MYKTTGFHTWVGASLVLLLQACSAANTPDSSSSSGGSGSGTGGNRATGGSSGSATGGSSGSATGGSSGSATGGSSGNATGGSGSSSTGGSAAGGSTPGTGGQGNPGSGGRPNTGGSSSDGGGGAAGAGPADAVGGGGDTSGLPKFSFFVTSLEAMRKLSGNMMGFGGDLTFGKADGLTGADEICRQTAELGLAGAGQKEWHAFLSTTAGGPDGGPVHAINRLGNGPWYDRLGRLVALNKADLVMTRPKGADPIILNDLPNEHGIPNHAPDPGKGQVDNHDMLTGTGPNGMLYKNDKANTCNDWTNKTMTGKPWCGHAWPRQGSGINWMSALAEGGCAPGVNLVEQGGPNAPTVGSGGGYGGIYCFASTP